MTFESAEKEALKYINLETTKTLCVVGNGEVYINNDIEAMKQNAKDRGVEIFVFKGEKEVKETAKKVEEATNEVVEEPKKKTKKK